MLLEQPTPPVVVQHDETGYVSFIGAGSQGAIEVAGAARSARPEDRAAVYLDAYVSMFGFAVPAFGIEHDAPEL